MQPQRSDVLTYSRNRRGSAWLPIASCYNCSSGALLAIFHVITFLIHAIVSAMASLLLAVFTHVLPALIAGAALLALTFAACTSCGVGGLALLRRRKKRQDV